MQIVQQPGAKRGQEMTEEKFAEITVAIWRKRQELEALTSTLLSKQITANEFFAAFLPARKQLLDNTLKLTRFLFVIKPQRKWKAA